MKCRYSAFNAQGSRPIIVVVQLRALKEEKELVLSLVLDFKRKDWVLRPILWISKTFGSSHFHKEFKTSLV